MSHVVYADSTDAQLIAALERLDKTQDEPAYLELAADAWLLGDTETDADLAAALWRYTRTKSAPTYLKLAAARWMEPR